MDSDGLLEAERLLAPGSLERLALDRSPNAVARRHRRHREVRAAAPLDVTGQETLQRHHMRGALGAVIAGVIVADPPQKFSLGLGIADLVIALQFGHSVER